MDAQEYEKITQAYKDQQKRMRNILLACVSTVVIIVIIIISSIIGFVNDPQRTIAKESKALLKQAEQLVKDGDYTTAVDILDQISLEWDDYSNTNTTRQKAERGIMLEEIYKYQTSGNYEDLMVYIEENVTIPNSDDEIQAIYEDASRKCKENAMAQILSYTATEDYLSAIQYIDLLGVTIKCDNDIKEAYDSAVANYESAVISEAEKFAQSGDFASSRSTLSIAENYIGRTIALADKITKINEQELTAQVLALIEKDCYGDAIVLLKNNVAIVSGCTDLQMKQSTYTEKYRASVINEAEAAYKADGYESAVSVLHSAMQILENDELLLAEKNKYDDLRPIPLTEMEVLSFGRNGKYNVDIDKYSKDKYGNNYSTSFSVNEYDSIKWFVNGKYQKMTGTIACPKDYDYYLYYSNVIVTIYCDGKKVFTSKEAGPEEKPQTFSIDLTGVEELEIKWSTLEALNIWHNWCAYGTMFDAQLYPNG